MDKTNHEKQIIDLCYHIYPRKITGSLIVPEDNFDFQTYLQNNRLAYVINNSQTEYIEYKTNIIRELTLLKKVAGDIPFIVLKTISSYPHLTSDIDVLVRTEEQAIAISKALKKEKNIPIMIDINHVISWTYTKEISNEFIWNNTLTITVDKLNISVPNSELDTLIRLGHIPFELAEFRLGELMHIFNTAKNIRWDVLKNEATNMKWPATYQRMIVLLDKLHLSLYDKPFIDGYNYNFQAISLNFPLRLSYWMLFQAFLEKRAWKKLKGAKYVVKDRLPLWAKKIFS